MSFWLKWFYDFSYRFSKPPWETGITPPEVVEQITSGEIRSGRALDLGCGTGTNSIYLAKHGFETIGVDFSSKAIELAKRKSRKAKVDVTFHVGDVTRLDFLSGPFDIVLDIGCFHGLDPDSRVGYSENLVRLTCPGSLFMLYAFEPRPTRWGRLGVTHQEARRTFGTHMALYRFVEGSDRRGLASAWYWFVRQ